MVEFGDGDGTTLKQQDRSEDWAILEQQREERTAPHPSQAYHFTKNMEDTEPIVDGNVLDRVMKEMPDDFGMCLGDLQGALRRLRSVLSSMEQNSLDSLESAICRSNIGVVQKAICDYDSAMKHHREALVVIE